MQTRHNVADRAIVLAAVKRNGMALQYTSTQQQEDREIVLAAIENDINALQFVDKDFFRDDRDVLLVAAKHDYFGREFFSEISDDLARDREFALAAVSVNGLLLKYLDASLRKDVAVVVAAVKNTYKAYELADVSLERNRDVARAWSDMMLLMFADGSEANDRTLVLDAMRRDGSNLRHVTERFKSDRDVVLEAVRSCPWALDDADVSLQGDKEIVLTAVRGDGMALRFADPTLRQDPEIALAAVENNGLALQFIVTDARECDR